MNTIGKPQSNPILIKVRVKTGARAEKLLWKKDILWVEVREAAKENRANTRVRELVAEHLKVPLRAIRITKGHHRPSKLLQVVKHI